MESEADCGEKWRGSLAKYDPDTHSLKTAQLSLIEDSTGCYVTLPRSGWMRGGECYQLPMLVRRTNGNASGLWRTPTVGMLNADRAKDPEYTARKELKGQTITLADQVKHERLWPTPTVCWNHNRKGASATSGDGLATAVKMWPTPKAHEPGMSAKTTGRDVTKSTHLTTQVALAEGMIDKQTGRMWRTPSASVVDPKSTVTKLTGRKPSDQQVGLADQVGGQLNPNWVEWLMGWPTGWTDLKPLETGKSHCAQQQRGACSQVEDDAV
jgi:DNA (cytosine-5)-methyltransferase 1